MNYDIVHLPQENWQDHVLVFRYETRYYFDAVLEQDDIAFGVTFLKKPLDCPVQKEFTDQLYRPWWEGAQAYGVFSGNNIIGCLEVWQEGWSNRLRVTELWVDEQHRRQGIGKALMDYARIKTREWNCRALILETQSCNEPAINFYLAQGLSFFGFDRNCYGNQDVEKREVRIELGLFLPAGD